MLSPEARLVALGVIRGKIGMSPEAKQKIGITVRKRTRNFESNIAMPFHMQLLGEIVTAEGAEQLFGEQNLSWQ